MKYFLVIAIAVAALVVAFSLVDVLSGPGRPFRKVVQYLTVT